MIDIVNRGFPNSIILYINYLLYQSEKRIEFHYIWIGEIK